MPLDRQRVLLLNGVGVLTPIKRSPGGSASVEIDVLVCAGRRDADDDLGFHPAQRTGWAANGVHHAVIHMKPGCHQGC